ncbi:MAG TPA: OmpA family protein [Acidobacteriaceae bacterium]|nr:OmpA family protein [Acidobacteriaceae bacterium]
MRMGAAGVLLLMLAAGCESIWGQSHDASHPTPLAAGVNKGNVDSIVGPNYYYFYAGPGHWEVHLAFHEMGFLGQPHRQKANFDFTNPEGRVSHMEIWSQGNTATVENHGDFAIRKRMVLAVSGQSNLVRLGGYYEVTVSGAASFDGKEGSSANVKLKESEALIHPMTGSLVHPSSDSLVHPSDGSLIHPQGPLVYPGKPLLVQETAHEVRITLAADVLFDFGKSAIRADAEKTLREAATKMKFAHAKGPIRVDGYTDAKGAAQLNERLSAARATAVEDWMIRNAGFSARELDPRGYGAERPVAANTKPDGTDNPEGRQRNRRVEIVVTR